MSTGENYCQTKISNQCSCFCHTTGLVHYLTSNPPQVCCECRRNPFNVPHISPVEQKSDIAFLKDLMITELRKLDVKIESLDKRLTAKEDCKPVRWYDNANERMEGINKRHMALCESVTESYQQQDKRDKQIKDHLHVHEKRIEALEQSNANADDGLAENAQEIKRLSQCTDGSLEDVYGRIKKIEEYQEIDQSTAIRMNSEICNLQKRLLATELMNSVQHNLDHDKRIECLEAYRQSAINQDAVFQNDIVNLKERMDNQENFYSHQKVKKPDEPKPVAEKSSVTEKPVTIQYTWVLRCHTCFEIVISCHAELYRLREFEIYCEKCAEKEKPTS